MEKIINIGVLGVANIAKRSVMPTINELPENFNLIGIASRTKEKSEETSILFKTKAYKGYQSLLDDTGLKAVYIPLPNGLHAEWIEKALKANLHILVEKSMACEYNDVVRLNEIAKQKQLVLVENFQFRFHKQLQYIINMVSQGLIGELRCLRSSFGFPGLSDENDIRYKKELGGGALLDTGAYPLKIAQIFLGQEIEVKAATLSSIKGKEVNIFGGAYVKQKNGALFGQLAFGFNHHYQCNIELWGSKGKIYTNRIFTANNNYEPIIELETQKGMRKIILPADHHFKNMLLHFYKLIISKNGIDDEYKQNINQARLINELKIKANE